MTGIAFQWIGYTIAFGQSCGDHWGSTMRGLILSHKTLSETPALPYLC